MEVLLVEIYPLKKWNFSSRAFYSVRSSIKYGRKIFRKTNISNPLMRTQTCVYQGLQMLVFRNILLTHLIDDTHTLLNRVPDGRHQYHSIEKRVERCFNIFWKIVWDPPKTKGFIRLHQFQYWTRS